MPRPGLTVAIQTRNPANRKTGLCSPFTGAEQITRKQIIESATLLSDRSVPPMQGVFGPRIGTSWTRKKDTLILENKFSWVNTISHLEIFMLTL